MGYIIHISYGYIMQIGINIIDETRELIAVSCAVSAMIGMLVYIALTVVLNIKEAKELIDLSKNKAIALIRR
ncbi:hypothetical protein SDC9_173696 [bioreactor metagenome]|uniref:Uncharacterized protein n=1 Tax=bioreactor metagenome TaxID=1076179 RepID=A0A645GK84_9ZZZZ